MRRPDFLGRILPAQLGGAVETEKGLQQSAASKQVTGAIPIPFGAVLRSFFPPEDTEAVQRQFGGLPITELLLRGVGASPRVITPEVLEQAYEELQRKAREAQTAQKQASYYAQ